MIGGNGVVMGLLDRDRDHGLVTSVRDHLGDGCCCDGCLYLCHDGDGLGDDPMEEEEEGIVAAVLLGVEAPTWSHCTIALVLDTIHRHDHDHDHGLFRHRHHHLLHLDPEKSVHHGCR
jgi:hypothetical protein